RSLDTDDEQCCYPAREFYLVAGPEVRPFHADAAWQLETRNSAVAEPDFSLARSCAPPRQRYVRVQRTRSGGFYFPSAQGAVGTLPRQTAQRSRLPLGDRSGEAHRPPVDRRGRLAPKFYRRDQVRRRSGRETQGGVARARALSLDAGAVG